MLRAPVLRSRALRARAIGSRQTQQWLGVVQTTAPRRLYADLKKPDATILPGSQSTSTPAEVVPPPPKLSTPEAPSAIPVTPSGQAIPKIPPTPAEVSSSPPITVKSSTPPPPISPVTTTVAPPPPPPPPKKKHRLRNFIVNLIILSGLGYGIGVYYALTSDNWHDFFTEYVPFGEDAVAYFEEREFRKRFLSRPQQSRLHEQVRGEPKVHIPGRSGVSAKTAVESADLGAKGPHISAVSKPKSDPAPHPETVKAKSAEPADSKPTDSTTHQLLPKPKDGKAPEAPKTEAKPEPTPSPAKVEPAKHIDNLNIPHATEPVVQDVVKILNDIITVVNADNASSKYSSTIEKAKGDLSKVIADIEQLKQLEHQAAEKKVASAQKEFEDAAVELLRRQDDQIRQLELQWREEYENERGNLNKAYDSKLKEELDASNKIYDQKLKNELLKQAINLRREFTGAVKDTVEAEREGRLGKLNELSSSVQELQKLTGEWNSVVNANLQTQRLLVAVEAVKSSLDNAERPTPFIAELAALKEVAASNPVVDAAIASINPLAYQRGIPTPAQLIDRFRRVASEVRKASLLPDNAGVASHAASLLLSKVMFKKAGLPVGDDVESVLTRAEILLEEGHLEAAVREVNTLTGWAKTLSRDWLAEGRRVLEVQQAVDVIATEARLQSLLVE